MTQPVQTPVGRWSGTVSHDNETDEYTVVFSPNGTLSLTTAKSTGEGTWSVTGDGKFQFTVREIFNQDVGQHSPNGKRAAYIEIKIHAEQAGSAYTGSGTAQVHGPDGTVIYATTAQTTAQLQRPHG